MAALRVLPKINSISQPTTVPRQSNVYVTNPKKYGQDTAVAVRDLRSGVDVYAVIIGTEADIPSRFAETMQFAIGAERVKTFIIPESDVNARSRAFISAAKYIDSVASPQAVVAIISNTVSPAHAVNSIVDWMAAKSWSAYPDQLSQRSVWISDEDVLAVQMSIAHLTT